MRHFPSKFCSAIGFLWLGTGLWLTQDRIPWGTCITLTQDLMDRGVRDFRQEHEGGRGLRGPGEGGYL